MSGPITVKMSRSVRTRAVRLCSVDSPDLSAFLFCQYFSVFSACTRTTTSVTVFVLFVCVGTHVCECELKTRV